MPKQSTERHRAASIQFYFRQFAGDEQVMSMDLDAVGAHILLMCSAGASSRGYRLPSDERFLRSQIKFPKNDDWARIKQQLLSGAWKISEDGKWWVQEGLKRSIYRINEFVALQREKGKKGAAKRWSTPNDSRGHKSAVPVPMAHDSLSSSSSSTNLSTTPSISPPCQDAAAPQALSSEESEKTKHEAGQAYEPGDSSQEQNHGQSGTRKRNTKPSGGVHSRPKGYYDGF